MAGEDAGVVAITLDGAGVARNTVLLQSGRALVESARKKEAGNCRAFPERGLSGKLALAEGGNPKRGQVAQRAAEPGRGDHIIGRHGQLSTVRSVAGPHNESGRSRAAHGG